MRIATLSGPNSMINGTRREAHDGCGCSRVPRRASVRILSFKSGLFERAVRNVEISAAG